MLVHVIPHKTSAQHTGTAWQPRPDTEAPLLPTSCWRKDVDEIRRGKKDAVCLCRTEGEWVLLAPASVGVGGLTSVLFILRNSLFLHLRSLLSGPLPRLLHIYLLPFSPSHFLPNVLCIPAEVKTLTQGQREFRDLLQFLITPMQDTGLFQLPVLFYIYCYVTGPLVFV